MKIIFLRFIDGKNTKFENKIIDMLVENLDEVEAKHIYESFESINNKLCISGKGLSLAYKNEEARMVFSYKYKFVAKQILEDLVNDINIESIISLASDILKNSLEKNIEMECIEKNIPFYYYKENEVQLGYGANNIIIKSNQDINYDNIKNNGYIPIITVTGSNGKTTTVKLIYNILLNLGYRCGMSSTGGVYINGKLVLEGDTTGYFSAKEVLKSKEVDFAILECARGGIIKQGLAYKNSDVAIITSLTNDHTGMEGVKSKDDLSKVKSLITKVVKEDGIIIARADYNIIKNIDNDKNLILFDNEKTNYMEEFIKRGKECFYVEDNFIIREYKDEKKKILDVTQLDFAYKGASKSNIRNIICAYIAVRHFHSNIYEIINAIKSIKCNQEFNLGRQNIIEYGNKKFIIDYGHNDEAFQEVFNLAKNILNKGRIISIISAPGDRSNSQIIKLGVIAAKNSDIIIVKEIKDRRGRKIGEIANMLLYGINKTKFNSDNVKLIIDESEAFNYVMENLEDNDVVIYFVQDKNEISYAMNKLKSSEV